MTIPATHKADVAATRPAAAAHLPLFKLLPPNIGIQFRHISSMFLDIFSQLLVLLHLYHARQRKEK